MNLDSADPWTRRQYSEVETPAPRPRTATSERWTPTDGSSAPASPIAGQQSPNVAKHQRFVLADGVALSYLEEDPSVRILERMRELEGFQLFMVEQWCCSRTAPTYIILSYTGVASHKVTVGVVSVPADESTWSTRLKVYFKAMSEFHARKLETSLGTVMITNLSNFPSSLTLIPVPSGNLRLVKDDFFVNENLKRLGCSGRVGISLSKPTAATETKFLQLYKTSDKVPLYSAVLELVKLCQAALMLFGVLDSEYVDGLLCDFTEKAAGEWWWKIGTGLYSIEPSDGALGPTTVSALLGTLLGARNRLQAISTPVAKDVFDLETTKRGISHFQKTYGIPRTRRLDRRTLTRLHRATDKQATGESWLVPRAVKSTVAELSGKGGEMVMDFVGGKDKAGIAEVETTDIDTFAQLVNGDHCKWLWLGKPRKRTTRDIFSEAPTAEGNLVFQEDEETGYSWASRRKDSVAEGYKPRPRISGSYKATGEDPDPLLKKTVLRRAKGRLKDAVGIKSHAATKSKDEDLISGMYGPSNETQSLDTWRTSQETPNGHIIRKSEDYARSSPMTDSPDSVQVSGASKSTYAKDTLNTPVETPSGFRNAFHGSPVDTKDSMGNAIQADLANGELSAGLEVPYESQYAESVTKSEMDEEGMDTTGAGADTSPDLLFDDLVRGDPKLGIRIGRALRRTRSTVHIEEEYHAAHHPEWYPRHLSFSVAEEAVLVWDPIDAFAAEEPLSTLSRYYTPSSKNNDSQTLYKAFQRETFRAQEIRELRAWLASIGRESGLWVEERLDGILHLDTLATQDMEQLNSLYYPRKDEFQTLREGEAEILNEEQRTLREAVREVEAVKAKLDYEINALRSKVEDVEDAVAEFDRQVTYTEARASDLTNSSQARPSWATWSSAWLAKVMPGSNSKSS